ncbi:hypothetical protein IFT80_02375 [Pseudomonas sp. CFBP 8771]|uniref:hypothetical protein n=1 Tax=Pseudomonas sp. CFBP 8771 TaxID=2775285 RepID=UPI00177C9AF5|nr:hypothetical protein [Pseudomonas sp. CFBP 8771]MBD8601482.1 hypothetical protein [Pseudomonas sp. CFBP 8771]
MEALSSILPAVFGGFISSGLITYYLGAMRAEREVRRNKLEGVYAEMEQNIRRLQAYGARQLSNLSKIENNLPLLENGEKDSSSGPTVVDRHLTILTIYFPSVTPSYRAFFSACQNLNGIVISQEIHRSLNEGPLPSRRAEAKLIFESLFGLGEQVSLDLLYEADKINCSPLFRFLLKRRLAL